MSCKKFYQLHVNHLFFSFSLLIVFVIISSCHGPKVSDAGTEPVSQTQVLPFSPAVEANGTLYISGQISPGVKGEPKPIEQETREVMEKIGEILKQNGYEFTDVVHCAVFLVEINDYQAVNKVYASFFNGKFPSRVAMEVSRLVKGSRIEISAIAVKSNKTNAETVPVSE